MTKVNWYVKHTDTDANMIRFFGPFSEEIAKEKANHFNLIGHQGEAFQQTSDMLHRAQLDRKNKARREKHQAMKDLGLVRVRGSLGGIYYE